MSLYVFLHFPPIIIILSSNPLFHSYVLVHVSCVRCDIPLHSIIDSFAGWKKLIFIPSFVRRNDYNAHLSLLTKSSSPHIHSTYIWILMNTNETEKISWTHFQFCMMFFPLHSSSSLLDGKQFFLFLSISLPHSSHFSTASARSVCTPKKRAVMILLLLCMFMSNSVLLFIPLCKLSEICWICCSFVWCSSAVIWSGKNQI